MGVMRASPCRAGGECRVSLPDCTPHFSFRLRRKEKRAVHGPKRKGAAAGRYTLRVELQAAGGGKLAGPVSKVRDGNDVAVPPVGAGCKSGIVSASISAKLAAPAVVVEVCFSTERRQRIMLWGLL